MSYQVSARVFFTHPLLRGLNKNPRAQLSHLAIGINLRDGSRPTYLTCTSSTCWQLFTDCNRLQTPSAERWFPLRLGEREKGN